VCIFIPFIILDFKVIFYRLNCNFDPPNFLIVRFWFPYFQMCDSNPSRLLHFAFYSPSWLFWPKNCDIEFFIHVVCYIGQPNNFFNKKIEKSKKRDQHYFCRIKKNNNKKSWFSFLQGFKGYKSQLLSTYSIHLIPILFIWFPFYLRVVLSISNSKF
jgi:hypothetical protein